MNSTSGSVIEAPSKLFEAAVCEQVPGGLSSPVEQDLSGNKIWIDLDNSPHVPFFVPIMEKLKERGAEVMLTARNTYQVCDLLELFQLHCEVVGRHYGKHKVMKVVGNASRALQLAPTVAVQRPDLAISHGSRAQVLVGKALGIPTVLMQDYEFSTRTGFLEADWVFTPEVVPNRAMCSKPERVLKYPGLKEDVYVLGFIPDRSILKELNVSTGNLLVTLRPPATEAHYHNPESDVLFAETLKFLDRPQVTTITLPRSPKQEQALRQEWSSLIASGRMIIPDRAIDGLNLIWFSDLVISGGGTMNREAAALGTPVYSIFQGKIGAVDKYLAEQGRLTLIESAEEVHRKIVLRRWNRPSRPDQRNRSALRSIVENIAMILRHNAKRGQ